MFSKPNLNLLWSICVLFYSSSVCMSSYTSVYFKTICECIRQSIFICPRSITGVPFDSVRRFWATLLPRTTGMRLWGNWVANCVAASQTKPTWKPIRKWAVWPHNKGGKRGFIRIAWYLTLVPKLCFSDSYLYETERGYTPKSLLRVQGGRRSKDFRVS